MAASLSIKVKWSDNLNASWMSEKSRVIADRDGVKSLYDRLTSSQEVIAMPNRVVHLKGVTLPDFDTDTLSLEEEEHYLDALLSCQLTLARAVCSDSPFSIILQKRLIILQRMFYAISTKCHDREKVIIQQQSNDAALALDDTKRAQDKSRTGTDALIEMGVKTGLNLVFSLLRQNWMFAQQISSGAGGSKTGSSMCNDVLKTALDVVSTFPSLSLSNDNKLPTIAVTTLNEVTAFLKSTAMPSSGADIMGKRLASELMLALATQRGSMRYLLEWIDMALCASSSFRPEVNSSEDEPRLRMITHNTFIDILLLMMKSAVSILFKVVSSLWEPISIFINFQFRFPYRRIITSKLRTYIFTKCHIF